MGKYSPLEKFLSLHRENKITLTLEQIEIIINDVLPKSARIHHAWWHSPFHHPHVRTWTDVGWTVEVHTDKGRIEWVNFRRE